MNPAICRRPLFLALICLCVASVLIPAVVRGQTPDETSPVFIHGLASASTTLGSGSLPVGGSPVASRAGGATAPVSAQATPDTLVKKLLGSFLGAFFGSGFEGFVNAVGDAIMRLLRDLQKPTPSGTGTATTPGTETGTAPGNSTSTGLPTSTGNSASTGLSASTSTGSGSSTRTGTQSGSGTGTATTDGEIETRYAGPAIPRGQQQSPIPGFSPARSPSSKVVAKANAILKRRLPIGSTVQFTIDGKTYMARMEWHKHAATDNVSDALKDWHHGVTIYQQK